MNALSRQIRTRCGCAPRALGVFSSRSRYPPLLLLVLGSGAGVPAYAEQRQFGGQSG